MKRFTKHLQIRRHTKLKRFSRSATSVVLAVCLLISCMTVGIVATDAAQYNQHWQAKKLYFVAPDSWDLSTYSHVQVDITRTTSTTDTAYQCYIASMTRVGTSRLYYADINANHNGWNQNEYIAFTANSSDYGNGDFTLKTNHYYTTPKDYGVNNSNNFFVAIPDSDTNGCTVSMDWNATRDTLMKKTQTGNVYTNKASSSLGGSISLSGYYFSSDTAIASSSSSSSYDSVVGTTMTMTATANTGYDFDGWYSDSSCTTRLSSDTSYSYTVTGAKTVYANFTKKTYNISFSQPSNGSIKINNSTSSPVAIEHGNSVSILVTPNTGYKIKTLTDNDSAVSAAVGSTSAYTYTISSVTAAHTIAATMEAAHTQLSAPTNVKLNNNASDLTVDAQKDGKVTLSWSAVSNAGSYKIYKDGGSTPVTTVTAATSYQIEKGYSYGGTYTVVAVPSNTNTYSESPASTGRKLTVNKVQLNAPTVSQSASEVVKGSTVEFTLTNTNSSYTAGTDYKYQHSGENNSTYADVTNLTWTTSALNTTGTRTFKFKATALLTDYYTDSSVVEKTVTVCASYVYCLTGDMVTGQSGESGWPTKITTYPVNTFVSNNVFYRTVTISGGGSNDKHYFRLTNQSNQYTVTSGQDTDMAEHNSSSSAVTASTTGTNGAMYVTGNGNFKVYVDQSTSGQPKVWVISNEWSLTTTSYFQSYNLQTDSYNEAEQGNTGGTASPGSVEVLKGSSTTLSATAASGYSFAGWYNDPDFDDGHRVSTSANYTFTPNANGDYYALFKQNTPAHYNVTAVNSDGNANVSVTYNGTTITAGSGTLSVPVGASVTYSISAKTGCQINSRTPSSLITSNSGSFTMPASATAVTVTASKINYTLTGVISPNYGTLKFYSNSDCTTEITTAQYNQTFYAKYVSPSGGRYALDSYSISGTGATKTATNTTTGVGTFKMGTANVTVTANIKAATPSFTGTWTTSIEVYANESFDYNDFNTSGTVSPTGTTLQYRFNGSSYQNSSAFTAPATKGTYQLVVRASNQPTGISTAATKNLTVNVIVKYRENNVTYYVDMHGNNMTGKKVQVAIVTNSSSTTPVTDNNNNPCSALLNQVGDSSIYSATITTPAVRSGANYNSVYVRVTYGTYSGSSFTSTDFTQVTTLNTNQVSGLVTSQTMWLEAVNDSSVNLKYTTGSTVPTPVADGFRRIYLAKPYDWQSSESSWGNIGIYYWGNNTQNIGWDSNYSDSTGKGCVHMSYLGYDSTDGCHYYYADIPKNITETVSGVTTTYKVHSLIFQGWGSNQTNSSFSKTQTDNIDISADSANYFKLTNESGYSAVRQTDAVIPSYTKRYSSVTANASETTAINIAPTYKGENITYTTSDPTVVLVDANGRLTLRQKGTATITVKIYGTIGALVTAHEDNDHKDYLTYTTTVTVHDPTKFQSINPMSLDTAVYTVQIPTVNNETVNNDQPGYFDLSGTSVEVTGLANGAKSSAIITRTGGSAQQPTAFTVTYAKSTPTYFPAYQDISLTGTVVTKSLTLTGSGERYGLKEWRLDPGNALPSPAYLTQKSITGSVETVTTSGIAFSSTYSIYKAIFEKYEYVDVTFTFTYDEYKPREIEVDPETHKTMIQYPYDADWADESNTNNNYANSHTTKTITVSSYEVRGKTASTVTAADLVAPAVQALEAMPSNNYYYYSINTGSITISNQNANNHTADAAVGMDSHVQHYTVTLNGNTVRNNYTYQEYADLNVNTSSLWYAVADASITTPSAATDPVLATGTDYKFRVKGDTHIRTVAGSVTDRNFNRSEVDFSHYELTHRGTSPTNMKEYLLQNFYIADFFSPSKVLDSDNLPYDDAEFVGGGVVYYSMTNGSPSDNALASGYVDAQGVANAANIKEMLKGKIEENMPSAEVIADIGEEDAAKVAYGTEIAAQQNVENGVKTGILYRYLPLNTYQLDNNGAPLKDEKGNYVTTLNNNTFRYSNSLQSYQYVYASGNENKVTNNGRNMRLYSYYIYSYVDYDLETNLPETKYEVVLSGNYADASTYWAGNTNDPNI